jgi:ribosomal protein S18 acetylase RimI-like enzyme
VNPPFRLECLDKSHHRPGFSCGDPILDHYFQVQVSQDIRRRVANCFVAIETITGQVAGFYTIASTSIPIVDLPDDITQRLPRYPTIPAVRIGRLAMDVRFKGCGLGKALLADAALKTMASTPAAFALVVDAKNEQAAAFYGHHGFRPLHVSANVWFLPLATAEKVLLK